MCSLSLFFIVIGRVTTRFLQLGAYLGWLLCEMACMLNIYIVLCRGCNGEACDTRVPVKKINGYTVIFYKNRQPYCQWIKKGQKMIF